jgi:cellulose synthase/poly-beta-1,6-N-acetylglucosamine synthase-like glycosyltransferase
MIINIIFWISALLILHTYLGYPLLMLLLDHLFRKPVKEPDPKYTPYVSVLMAVHNEEAVIGKKIESLFSSEYPESGIEVLVGSDSSDDSTGQILEALQAIYPRLKVINFNERVGKPAVINKLFSLAKGELLILTDANVFPGKETIQKLVQNFSDSTIGLVDSRLINTGMKKDGISLPEVAYLSIEMKVKNAEGRLWGTMMGPFGGFYAIRKTSYEPLSQNTLADDFRICMNVIGRKEKAISDTDAVVYEDVSNSLREEFRRKVRISAGNFQNLKYYAFLLLKPFTLWTFCFVSHKMLRWLAPFLWIIAAAANIHLMKGSFFFSMLIFLQVIFIILPAFDFVLKKINVHFVPVRFLTHFLFMNIALFAGFIKYLRGIQTGTWSPTKRYQ